MLAIVNELTAILDNETHSEGNAPLFSNQNQARLAEEVHWG
jgi:hypothetical protein